MIDLVDETGLVGDNWISLICIDVTLIGTTTTLRRIVGGEKMIEVTSIPPMRTHRIAMMMVSSCRIGLITSPVVASPLPRVDIH